MKIRLIEKKNGQKDNSIAVIRINQYNMQPLFWIIYLDSVEFGH